VNRLTGWFFNYRGNGYGPFQCREKAIAKLHEKASTDNYYYFNHEYYNSVFNGNVWVENKQLVDIEPLGEGI
jgi:hypothetical protein